MALRSGPAGQDRPVTRKRRDISTYNEQRPNGIVEEDDRGNPEHGEAYNFVKLEERRGLAYLVGQTGDGRGAEGLEREEEGEMRRRHVAYHCW